MGVEGMLLMLQGLLYQDRTPSCCECRLLWFTPAPFSGQLVLAMGRHLTWETWEVTHPIYWDIPSAMTDCHGGPGTLPETGTISVM